MGWGALYLSMFKSRPHFKNVHFSDRACEGAWLWWSEQVRGIEDMLAGDGLRFVLFGLRLDFLLCRICSVVIGVEDVHVGQSVPGSQRENSWPGLHILGETHKRDGHCSCRYTDIYVESYNEKVLPKCFSPARKQDLLWKRVEAERVSAASSCRPGDSMIGLLFNSSIIIKRI